MLLVRIVETNTIILGRVRLSKGLLYPAGFEKGPVRARNRKNTPFKLILIILNPVLNRIDVFRNAPKKG